VLILIVFVRNVDYKALNYENFLQSSLTLSPSRISQQGVILQYGGVCPELRTRQPKNQHVGNCYTGYTTLMDSLDAINVQKFRTKFCELCCDDCEAVIPENPDGYSVPNVPSLLYENVTNQTQQCIHNSCTRRNKSNYPAPWGTR
jgi:hypothetical protein